MTIRTRIRAPFYSGSGVSTLVPHPWDAAVNGRRFMFDTKYMGTAQFTRSSIKLLKPQQDTGSVGENSLNPADGIRAAIESWHHGAGQTFLDRPDSDPYRFRSSKGIDPWTRHKITLQQDTAQRVESSNTNLALMPAGSRLYFSDGQSLKFVTSVGAAPSVTTVTSTPAVAVNGLASDGYRVWTAHGASGIYETNTGATSAAQRVTSTVGGVIGYVKGRLMAANGNAIYNVIDFTGSAEALPTALYEHPNTDFTWVGFAEGIADIYAAGYSGDKSIIYRTEVKADGTALEVPVVAATLPDGEIVRAIGGYLDLILIGTDSGWWVGAQDGNGDLTINKVQETDSAVRCFEGQGDFVWYGWTNYDSTSTGLGRADLRSDTKGASVVTPAYASDLMATAQGNVLSVATFAGVRVFAVSASGIYAETSDKVASGTLRSALITHGLPDEKVAINVTVTHEALEGSLSAALSTDGSTFTTIGSNMTSGSTSVLLNAGSSRGTAFELDLTLTRSSTDTTTGPEVTRATLESNFAPGRGESIRVAFMFAEQLRVDGHDREFDCAGAYNALTSIASQGAPVTYQDALGTETVTLEDYDFIQEGLTKKRDGFTGTFLAEFRRPRRRG